MPRERVWAIVRARSKGWRKGGRGRGVLLEVILPIFLVGEAGALVGRLTRLDATPMARIVLYLLGPALIFRSLYTSTVAGEDVLRIGAFVLILSMHFKRRPELGATAVFLTTVLSLGTLTLILSILN